MPLAAEAVVRAQGSGAAFCKAARVPKGHSNGVPGPGAYNSLKGFNSTTVNHPGVSFAKSQRKEAASSRLTQNSTGTHNVDVVRKVRGGAFPQASRDFDPKAAGGDGYVHPTPHPTAHHIHPSTATAATPQALPSTASVAVSPSRAAAHALRPSSLGGMQHSTAPLRHLHPTRTHHPRHAAGRLRRRVPASGTPCARLPLHATVCLALAATSAARTTSVHAARRSGLRRTHPHETPSARLGSTPATCLGQVTR